MAPSLEQRRDPSDEKSRSVRPHCVSEVVGRLRRDAFIADHVSIKRGRQYSGADPAAIIEQRGLAQITDPTTIREAATRVIENNVTQVAQYRGGKTQLFGFLVGQLVKETRGKAKAELANEVLREMLDS